MPRLVSFSTLTLALLAFAADPASAAACTIPVHSVIVSDAPANGLVRISV